jgi:hypothetical protein
MSRARLDAGLVEYVSETDPGPFGVADRSPLPADTRYSRAEQGPPIAGALQQGRQGDLRIAVQFGEAQPSRSFHQAINFQLPGMKVHGWGPKMAPDKELIDRRQPGIERGGRTFEVQGSLGPDDETGVVRRMMLKPGEALIVGDESHPAADFPQAGTNETNQSAAIQLPLSGLGDFSRSLGSIAIRPSRRLTCHF